MPDFSQTVDGTKKSMRIEVERLQKVATPQELILVVNDFITFCRKATSEAKSFKEDIPVKIQSRVKINEIVKEFQTKGLNCAHLYAFHTFLCTNIPFNSLEYCVINQEMEIFNLHLKHNIDYLAHLKGAMTEIDKQSILKPAFIPATCWEDLESISNDTFGFRNRTQGLKKPIFYRSTRNYYNKNLGVLKKPPENIDPSYYL